MLRAQQMYSEMRYFFEPLHRVQICTVSDTLPALQRPPPVRSARRGLSGIECRPVQRVQHPGGRVCRALHGLPCCLCRVAVPGALGLAGGTGGVYSRRPAPPGQSRHHRKNKKDPPHLHKTTPIRLCKSPKIPKNTKRPLSRSNLCYT